jgi:hypothetical protein
MLLIMAVAVAGNLHLPLVQAVAWARMYSHCREVYTPAVSIHITFSGQYPCTMCKLVASAEKERDNLAGSTISSLRILLPLPQPAILVTKPTETPRYAWTEPSAFTPSGFARPEVPPPRWA